MATIEKRGRTKVLPLLGNHTASRLVDDGRCAADAHHFGDQATPGVAAHDPIGGEAVVPLVRDQGASGVLAEIPIQCACGIPQGVERILQHQYVNAHAAISKHWVTGRAGGGAIALIKMYPGGGQVTRLDVAPHPQAIGQVVEPSAFTRGEALAHIEGDTGIVLALLAMATFPDAFEGVAHRDCGAKAAAVVFHDSIAALVV